uniref:Uncharacterized protein n=1 Tax=Rhizophora mucronata TaxID=61149 RepID=A0A2P2PQQ9_RHIMU
MCCIAAHANSMMVLFTLLGHLIWLCLYNYYYFRIFSNLALYYFLFSSLASSINRFT